MKKLLTIAALALGLTVTSHAQIIDTNNPFVSGPIWDAIKSIGSGTNLAVGLYGTYNSQTKDKGGGIIALYNFNQFVGAGIRLDYLSSTKTVYMPSFNAQLQAPINLGKLELVPFVITGVATPIAGRASDNGAVVGIFGAGTALRITKNLDLALDLEKWTGFSGQYMRAGFIWKF